jgi:hypothetical protein
MPDIAHSLIVQTNSRRTKPAVRTGLRAAFAMTCILICFVLAVLWIRSYTWRDRAVIPLTDTKFCRIDSEQGRLRFESYGPSMGEMVFSISALSLSDITRAWHRFTTEPEPGPGKQWRWEHSQTGRFFVHMPHWFLLGISGAVAALPWVAWRFSLRTFLLFTTGAAAVFGLLTWASL